MARLLPESQVAWAATARSISNNTTLLLLLLLLVSVVAAVASVIMALCTTRKHSGMQEENKDRAPTSPPKEERRRQLVSTFSRQAMLVTKMVSWKKAPEESAETSGDVEEAALWKKTIIMGDKCRPWNFSGQISYDSTGQRLPETNKNSSP